MRAVKGNRSYKINADESEAKAAQGYDIYDDDGRLVKRAVGKKVDYREFAKLKEENAKLKEEVAQLKKQIGNMEQSTGNAKKRG